MTTIRSAIDSDSSWLCVTWMNIRPSWRWRFAAPPASVAAAGGRGRRAARRAAAPLARHEHAGERDPLLLAARKRARLAVGQRARPTISSAVHCALAALLLRHAAHLQPELDVLEHRAVGEEREVLENGRRRALVGREPEQALSVEQDVARSSAPRVRRSSGASSSSRSPRGRAGRRTRRGRSCRFTSSTAARSSAEELRQTPELEAGSGRRGRGGGPAADFSSTSVCSSGIRVASA